MSFLLERMTRQGLARRSSAPTVAVSAAAVGIQAQDLGASRLGIRARTTRPDEAAVIDAFENERSVVRTWLMRATVHLVPATDVGWMTALFGPMIERRFRNVRWRELGLEPVGGVRLLPMFDNYLIGYRDRSALLAKDRQAAVYVGGIIKATVVRDGRVVGIWRLARSTRTTSVEIEPFEPLTRGVREEVEREVVDLERFTGRAMKIHYIG